MIELLTPYSFSQIPYITYDALDDYAESVVNDFMPERLNIPAPLDVMGFIENYLGLSVAYYKLSYEGLVMGFTAFHDSLIQTLDERTRQITLIPVKAGTIILDTSLKTKRNEQRLRFTGTHEGCHWLIHRNAFSADNIEWNSGIFNLKQLAAKKGRIDYSRSKLEKTDYDRMERQADFVSAAILIPKPALRIAYRRFFEDKGIKPYVINRNADPKEDVLALQLTQYIAGVFNVSKRAALIRLEKLHAIVDRNIWQYRMF
jgi:hypothetical protein